MFRVFNTLTRKIEDFVPLKSSQIGIYSCGPTVYWNQHIGHMYAYVQWDVLVRLLKSDGFDVKWVMNITDVGHMVSDEDEGEDKMEKGAKREGLSVLEIAEKYMKQFIESMGLLNIQKPDVLCKATDNINEIIELIKKIESRGFTYKTKTGLVFDTSKFSGYADFAKLNLEKQTAGARVEVDNEKKQPWDFLLWVTNQPEHVMLWDSPWGKGFPGWHIECTAMSTKYLGEKFDIHTGGREHIPVHHTNEIAQAFGAYGTQTANYWLHNDWLLIDGEKMSKSLGNNVLVTDLQEKGFDPMALRYLILSSHYRQGINFTWESLGSVSTALKNIISEIRAWESPKQVNNQFWQKFLEAANNDLNTPQALAVMWELIKSDLSSAEKAATILEMDKVLGLGLEKYVAKPLEIPEKVLELLVHRENARKSGDFKRSDELRHEIKKMGFEIEDTKDGAKIKLSS